MMEPGEVCRRTAALRLDLRKFVGHALDFAQRGDKHDAAKSLKGFGGAGVLKIATPKEDMDIIRARLKVAEALA